MQFKKPFISGLLAITLLANLLMPAFAYNSTGSTTDRVTGEDTAQNVNTEYQETTDTSSETQVYATRSSTFTVLVPKTIILSGSTGLGQYVVGVKGDVLAEDSISIEPDSYSLTLYRIDDHTKETPATVTQEQTSVIGAQIEAISPAYATMEGSIQANGLKAGSWSTTMRFNIALNEETTKPFTVTADNKTELGVTDTTTNLDIPANFVDSSGDNREVVGIDDNAFYDNNNLEKVTIPGSVESIGSNAFADCDNLGRVEVADEVQSIGNNAFGGVDEVIYNGSATGSPWGANNVYASIDAIPSHVHTLEHFDRVEATEESPGNIEYWHCTDCDRYYRDAGCTDEITLADTIIQKKGHSFIHVPASAATADHPAIIEHWKCENCGKYYSDANGTTEIGENDIYNISNEFIVTKDNRGRVNYKGAANESLIIPAAFKDTNGTWYKVVGIGSAAFKDCTNLTSIVIPDSVTSIQEEAFRGCTNLASVTIGNSVTSIGQYAFHNCSSLTSVVLPDSILGMGPYVFWNCTKLSSITYGSGIKSISPTELDGCTSLTSIEVSPDNPNYISVDGILFSKDKTTITKYPQGKAGSSYDIPATVTTIGFMSFEDSQNLTSILMPNSVTLIERSSFADCSKLSSINISNSVTTIEQYAFANDKRLTNLIIPNSVKTIYQYAFTQCTGLTNLVIPNSVTSIGPGAFLNVPKITYNGTATGSPWGAKSSSK